jgi:hypothetical protein
MLKMLHGFLVLCGIFAMRTLFVSMLMACTLSALTANAEPDSTVRPTYEATYGGALICMVANGYASLERRDAGDSAKATFYDGKAREAYDLAFQAGRYLGYGDPKIQADLDRVQAAELPKLMASVDYRRSVAATCKALRLL